MRLGVAVDAAASAGTAASASRQGISFLIFIMIPLDNPFFPIEGKDTLIMEYLEGSAPKIMFTCEYGEKYIFSDFLSLFARNKKCARVSNVISLTFVKNSENWHIW